MTILRNMILAVFMACALVMVSQQPASAAGEDATCMDYEYQCETFFGGSWGLGSSCSPLGGDSYYGFCTIQGQPYRTDCCNSWDGCSEWHYCSYY